ncbi:MAG: methyl-accepting chemotaxis protein [Spirochaetes bacterium]|nr:methyl-accepting chemotaxis protein [Spirochaetota bacterium]
MKLINNKIFFRNTFIFFILVCILNGILYSILNQFYNITTLIVPLIMVFFSFLYVLLFFFFFIPFFNHNKLLLKSITNLIESTRDKVDQSNIIDRFQEYIEGQENSILKTKTIINDNYSASINTSLIIKDSVYHTSNITGNIKVITEEMDRLNSNIANTGASLNQISQSVSSFVNQIEDQVSAVEETTSAVEEMNSSINNINLIAESKKQMTIELINLAQQSEAQINTTNDVVQKVSQNIKSINDFINVIDDIASRTNLLAMNAAIEAAHAGDSGKGFGVVAGEIRKLSESTTSNSKLIANNLKEIIKNINEITSSSKNSVNFFAKMKTEINHVANALNEIMASTQELNVGSQEIIKAMSSLNDISQTIKTGSYEIKESSEEINNAMVHGQKASEKSKSEIIDINESIGQINDIFSRLTSSMIDSSKFLSQLNIHLLKEIIQTTDINFNTLILQHILWMIKVRGVLDDRLTIDLNTVGDHTKCDLGQWIINKASNDLKETPDFLKMTQEHEELHSLIIDIIKKKSNTEREELEQQFERLIKLSEKIVTYLKSLSVIN